MPANECIPRYEGAYARKITGHATTAITGKRFVSLEGAGTGAAGTGAPQSGLNFGLSNTAEGENLQIGVPAAGERAWGVAAHDIASGGKGAVYGGAGVVLPVTSGAAVGRNVEVTTDNAGRAVQAANATDAILGRTVTRASASGQDVFVELYHGGHSAQVAS